MNAVTETAKFKRPPFKKRTINLVGPAQLETAHAALDNCPLDPERPLVLTLGEEVKGRTLDQNAAYHAGPLRDIAEQAWFDDPDRPGRKRQYSADTLHEHFKMEYLPEETMLDDDELMKRVKDPTTYRKWDRNLRGDRICVGSTTELTKFGFGEFREQVEAFGAERGVQFRAAPVRE
jgi:hypothetical protein